MRKLLFPLLIAALAAPLAARDSLGVYESWAAFRDPEIPRCYAIAKPRGANAEGAFASIGTWPKRNIRNLVHFRLSRAVPDGGTAVLRIDGARFPLSVSGRDAWAVDTRADAAIVAALRSARTLRVSARGFSDRYDLAGVATAMDAATVGCAQRN